MKMVNGRIALEAYHFDRLFSSLELLQMNCGISKEVFKQQIRELSKRNNCEELGRIRLTLFRTNSNEVGYSIEATSLDKEINQWNDMGWHIDICPHVRRAPDAFSHIKACNYLPYIMAARFAEEHDLHEALILNAFENICDASKTNLFLIKNHVIYTPSLDQGCISGVMRRFVIEEIRKKDWVVKETIITKNMLIEADEIFMTNAIQGIRWVKQFRVAYYKNNITREIYNSIMKLI
jgi:branched-chain amino acid aminotransferase